MTKTAGPPPSYTATISPIAHPASYSSYSSSSSSASSSWAASAARLGQLDAVWPVILAEHRKETAIWPDRCRVDRSEDGNCPEGQLVEYPDYPTALRAYLVELGYSPAA